MRALSHGSRASFVLRLGLVACIALWGTVLALIPEEPVTTTPPPDVPPAARTCPHSCRTEGTPPANANPEEVFGPDSRCFATRLPPPDGSGAWEYLCFRVSCTGSGGSCADVPGFYDEQGYTCADWEGYDCSEAVWLWGYSQAGEEAVQANCPKTCNGCGYDISVSDGASVTCGVSGEYLKFQGWTGEVFCDHKSDVCKGGEVVMAPEEERRDNITVYLNNMYDATTADTLMNYYDEGKFNPHTPEEGGFDQEFVVDHGNAACNWAATSLAGLSKTELPRLGMTFFRGVGSSALLECIQHGCTQFVEQGMQSHKDNFAETQNAPYGIDSLDGTDDDVYRRFFGGQGVTVFVLDTGVDPDHPELAGRVDTGADFTGSSVGSDDLQGHGTHCAGTIAGTSVGVAPQATIVAVKVLGDDGFSSGSSLFEGIEFVLDRRAASSGPMVASGSLGGGFSQSSNRAWKAMRDAGITVVVAAGNDDDNARFFSPASEPSIVTVGAIDEDEDPASFSNFGDLVDIWAPGVRILSARAGGGLTQLSGTSMACPHVSGVAALILEANPGLSPAAVEQEIIGDCAADRGRIKQSTGLILRTNAGAPPNGDTSSACILAGIAVAPTGSPTPAPTNAPTNAPTAAQTDPPETPGEDEDAEDGEDGDDGGDDGGSSAGGAIAAFVLLLIIAAVIFFLWWKGYLAGPLKRLRGLCKREGDPADTYGAPPQLVGVAPTGGRPPRAPAATSEPLDAPPQEVLSGPEWAAWANNTKNGALAQDITGARRCVEDKGEMANRMEEVWSSLRKNVKMASREGTLDDVPGGKLTVWYFIAEVVRLRPVYRAQVKEVADILEKSGPWKAALKSDAKLKSRLHAI